MAKLPTDAEISAGQAAFEPYFAAVGKVVHAWNQLQEQLGILFCVVVDVPREVGLSIWHANANDGAQRRMLRDAVPFIDQSKLDAFPAAVRDLKWLLGKADIVADRRNSAIHAPCSIGPGENGELEIQPDFGMNPRAKKLRGTQVLQEFEWCANCADALRRFARSADVALALEGYAWPDRPPLPSLPHTDRPTRR